ncbi:transposase [Thiocapsa bogorovii]
MSSTTWEQACWPNGSFCPACGKQRHSSVLRGEQKL